VSAAPSSTHYRTCNLCEAICGLAIEVADGRITGIRGDGDDPFSNGHICPKGVALQDLHEDPDRLRKPMKRTASGWEETTWDDALDLAARGLHETQTKYGRDALATYVGNPSVHNLGSLIFFPLLLRTLRSKKATRRPPSISSRRWSRP
jgi:anaerobic selenocysteine-containing dehydrogenase